MLWDSSLSMLCWKLGLAFVSQQAVTFVGFAGGYFLLACIVGLAIVAAVPPLLALFSSTSTLLSCLQQTNCLPSPVHGSLWCSQRWDVYEEEEKHQTLISDQGINATNYSLLTPSNLEGEITIPNYSDQEINVTNYSLIMPSKLSYDTMLNLWWIID